jgi:hypothetical protein
VRGPTLAYAAALLVGLAIVVSSAVGLASGADRPYGDAVLVLVSRGADVANLVLVLPILLGTLWLAWRGSLIGLLLWPGALFYVLYAYVPYLVGAPFGGLFFVHVGLVTLSALTVIGIVASIDADAVRERLAATPARGVGAALVVIALLAYAGLAGTAIGALADPAGEAATRPLAVADWALGTPILLAGGALIWLRMPLGYVAAPGLLLVSGLGGVAFALAAVVDNLGSGPQTEAAVIVVHVVISVVSFGLLALFLARARPSAPTTEQPDRGAPTGRAPSAPHSSRAIG